MRRPPGFLSVLSRQASEIPMHICDVLNEPNALTIRGLLSLLLCPVDDIVDGIDHPDPASVVDVSSLTDDDSTLGSTAWCIVASGTTSTGYPLWKLSIPGTNKCLLDVKLMQGRQARSTWILVDPSHRDEIQSRYAGCELKLIDHYRTIQFTPQNELLEPLTLVTSGDGDLIARISATGLLADFVGQGGKYVFVTSVKNALSAFDSRLVARHAASGGALTATVTKNTDAWSSVLCDYRGTNVIIPKTQLFCPEKAKDMSWAGTGDYVFDAAVMSSCQTTSSWHRVRKAHPMHVVSYGFERHLCDLTETFKTSYVKTIDFSPVSTASDIVSLKSHVKSLEQSL